MPLSTTLKVLPGRRVNFNRVNKFSEMIFKQARKPRSYASWKLRLTELPTDGGEV